VNCAKCSRKSDAVLFENAVREFLKDGVKKPYAGWFVYRNKCYRVYLDIKTKK